MCHHIWLIIYGISTDRIMPHPGLSAPCCLKGTRLDIHQPVLPAPQLNQYQYVCLLCSHVYYYHI